MGGVTAASAWREARMPGRPSRVQAAAQWLQAAAHPDGRASLNEEVVEPRGILNKHRSQTLISREVKGLGCCTGTC